MPELSIVAKNAALNNIPITQVSLHSQYDTAGGFELTGGSPLYARVPVLFAQSTNGFISAINAPLVFNVPPASTVAWIGMWDVFGNFQGMIPNGGIGALPFVISSGDLSSLICPNHGLNIGNTVVLWRAPQFMPQTPALNDFIEGVVYYVVNAATETIQLARTPGAAPLTVTQSGAGALQGISLQTFAGQNTFQLLTLIITANAVA